jgi:hypothetical protein
MESALLLSLRESTFLVDVEGFVMTTPTPEEAQRALQDIDDRKHEAAAAAASPRWWYIGCGIVTAAYGVLVDIYPNIANTWGNVLVWLVLLVVVARSSRWGGRRLRPRIGGTPARRWGIGVLGAIVIFALTIAALWLNVPHLTAWIGIGGGLLIALAGPWWQARMLQRSARR